MVDFFICVLANLFRMYLIRRYIVTFLGKARVSPKKEFAAFFVFYLINTLLFLQFHTVWINVLCNLVGIGLIVALYTKSLKTNIFVTSIIYFINSACDVIATLMFVEYQDGQSHSQICFIITVLLISISEIVTEKIVLKREGAENLQNLSLLLVPVCSVSMIWMLAYTDSCEDYGKIIVSVGLLIINFLMLYLYDLLLQSVSQKYEAEALRHKLQVYSNQLDIILQSEEKIKMMRHDMKHHMNEIKLLANKNCVEDIQEYINQMEAFINNPNEIVSSGNIEIDSVLNYMLQKAKQELYTVTSDIMLPEKIQHSFDINVLLGNLLENAIEAAKQTEEKFLNVYVALKQGVLKIRVENSFLPENLVRVEKDSQSFATSKWDKEAHGIGLASVRKIVESHNGEIEITQRQNVFCVNLVIYIEEDTGTSYKDD